MDDLHRLLDDALARVRLPDEPRDGGDGPPAFSDEALALRFTARHGDDLRFVAHWGAWMVWDGQRWRRDETQTVLSLARAIAREASAEVARDGTGRGRLAGAVASAKTVGAIERLARADRRHAAGVDDWDRDSWLLNTPGGTVDLRAGAVRPHGRGDLITKVTAVAPGGECPLWQTFLQRVFRGDQEMIKFSRRMLGYSLTGSIDEHALFFLHGTGGNGKGVFLNTWRGIVGDYGVVAPMETFTAGGFDRHPTELAMLRGARVVVAQETEAGQRWKESLIKQLTGGDAISARFMRQDFFSFQPTFKLLIAGNHRPSLTTVDEAIRRRFNLVPFDCQIPKDERDLQLTEKLRAEWPGILAWAIEGCVEWQRRGLDQPAAVLDATEGYLADEDTVGRFIDERCATDDPTAVEETGRLFDAWGAWCAASGEAAGTQMRLIQRLKAHGLTHGKSTATRRSIFRGIRLLEGEPATAIGPVG